MALSKESQTKSAFVLPGGNGKFEFTRCPFGLAQAPAYFQQLINQVLVGLPFAFGYLDDILVFSPDVDTHLKHLAVIFERLKIADLKLKESKCNFFKKHLQYLGHLLSGEGIEPLQEKLESVKKMPYPRNPTEIKQFLGLVGYYRKFVPRFSDIARPLSNLTKKDNPFEWTTKCKEAFQLLKDNLLKEPILKYPDPNKPYTLFTDASKYAWACVLTQQYPHEDEKGKIKKILHPITYMSGLFKGSQQNWAALTKEAYAIYMSIKKLTYYLEDAETTLRSDHLPLKKFLEKNTLNSKVNNWAVEISPFKITFEYIKGIKNTLADTMSRLIAIDSDVELPSEPEGHEFGYFAFDELPKIKVVKTKTNTVHTEKDSSREIKVSINEVTPTLEFNVEMPLKEGELKRLQSEDPFCKHLLDVLETGQMIPKKPYYLSDGILFRWISDNEQNFEAIVLPKCLEPAILILSHDEMGHNGSNRTYLMLRRQYYWKGMKKIIYAHVLACKKCQQRNKQVVKYATLHYDVPTMPMQFISMDLIGYLGEVRGFKYALTVICMLTGYVFCIPVEDKTAQVVIQAYIDNVYAQFGGSKRIMSDNGGEFCNETFEEVARQLGVEAKIYSPPYRPQSNGRIEGFHYFLKACITKHVSRHLTWVDVVPLATAAYNFFPNEHSKESPFFLMFGRDPLLPLNTLLLPKIRYMGTNDNILSLEALKNMYLIVAHNLKKAREKRGSKTFPVPSKLILGDKVLIKNHTAKSFHDTYIGGYRIVSIKGNQYEVKPEKGGATQMVHATHVKYQYPADHIIAQIPPIPTFGRQSRLSLHPDAIPDLEWQLATTWNTNFQTTISTATPQTMVNTLTTTSNSTRTSIMVS
jgi:transposase InsO family protein